MFALVHCSRDLCLSCQVAFGPKVLPFSGGKGVVGGSCWWQLQPGRRLEFLGLRGVEVRLKFLRLSVLDRVLLPKSVDVVSDFNGDL